MEFIKQLIDINSQLLDVFGYSLSYVEFIGTSFGLLSVWLAAKANVHTWSTGIINVLAFFAIYYQVQLYSDMLLQVFFLILSVWGLWKWKAKAAGGEELQIGVLSKRVAVLLLMVCLASVILLGWFMSEVHLYFPDIFPHKASFPYADALTTVLSIAASFLMAYKKLECWYLWLVVDLVCIVLYVQKGVLFIAAEYAVFLIIAAAGLLRWQKSVRYAERFSAG